MRDVLYHGEGLGGRADFLTGFLVEHRWRVHPVTTPESVADKLGARKAAVGLIHLESIECGQLPRLENLLQRGGNIEWLIVLPRHFTEDPALCRFISEFFFDYHTLPLDGPRLLNSLGHAYGKALLKARAAFPPVDFSLSLLGRSEVMRQLFHQMEKIRGVDTPVFLGGESGTGKELVARLIHQHSPRRHAPFVTVNCGALPPTLIQSELFGHEKGAFTGAGERKMGKIEAAQEGTVFLDEIGDLPLELQANLLRFLQEKTIERIGSRQTLAIDARVIAATHVDLEEAVGQGRFREDLYYRLNVLYLKLPPLRERAGDVELLAEAFLKKFVRENRSRVKGFSQQSLRIMNRHPWPGNVRELINRVQRAVVMCETPLITPGDLDLERRLASRALLTLDEARQIAETEAVRNSLMSNGNNISEAARQLGVSRVTLYRLMEKLKIEAQGLCQRHDVGISPGAKSDEMRDHWT
jgi:DNA-binding NtrC family response regulator